MTPPMSPESRPFEVGPVSLLRWEEGPRRTIVGGTGPLADVLEAHGVRHLEDLLSQADRERIDEARRGAPAPGDLVDIGAVSLAVPGGPEVAFHLTLTAERSDARTTHLAGSQATATVAQVTATHITGTFIELSGFRRAERVLREKSERLELVIEGTRLGTWDWNPQTGDVRFNEYWAEMLGYSLEEISFRLEEWESRVHPDDLAPCYEAIRAHLEGETRFYENVHRMRHRDGHWVHILDRGKVTEFDDDGRPVRFTGTHTDISLQREAELEAQEATRIKSEFLATMSHEIRTPLGGMLGLVEVLESTALSQDQREHLSFMRRCGEHLDIVLDDVLELTRLEADAIKLHREAFALDELVADLERLFTVRAEAKGLDLRCEVEASSAVVGDRHRLQQILTNLLANALKFTDEGSVRLEVQHDAGAAQLNVAVTDTGRGIANTDSIWASFRQGDDTIPGRFGGSGLGLTITQKLVRLMGGTVSVESERGAGSRFEVIVPAPPAVAVTDEASEPGEPAAAEGGRAVDLGELRVLAADDNEVNRLVLTHFLNQLGVTFEVVEDGEAALAAALRRPFDLVLMDLQMPHRDGRWAAKEIIHALPHARPRIVALTADVLGGLELTPSTSSFDAVVTKPFCRGDLEAQLLSTPRLHP